MGKSDKFSRGPGAGKARQSGGKGDKPTHFLCFPIASDGTVPVISGSLKQWMDATTRPFRKPPIRAAVSEEASTSKDPDASQTPKDEVTPNIERPTTETFAESLKILPPIVTRAAGTWHLTLGVMNLEEESRKQKALEVLHGLDLQGLLRDAEKGPPKGYKPARKWRDGEKEKAIPLTSASGEVDTTQDQMKGKEPDNQIQQPLHPITIALTGLGGFPSLKKARVLWARPREQAGPTDSADRPVLGDSERLYNFALHLIQPFRDAGLITETRALALHATVANMRFAKNKGRTPSWKSDQVDARKIGRVWNEFDGDVSAAVDVEIEDAEREDQKQEQAQDVTSSGSKQQESDGEDADEEESNIHDAKKEFVWLKDVEVNRVAICKLGASKHEDLLWREWYPAIEDGERLIFEL